MKKILLMTALCFAMMANAQEWQRQELKGDELIGTTDGVKWRYQVDNFAFMFMEGESGWKIGVGGGTTFKPDATKATKGGNLIAHATIGFYNENGELVKKIDDCMLELTEIMRVGETMKKWVFDKVPRGYGVNEYLRDEKGFVRIVAPLNLNGNYDLKLPCINK